MQKGLKNRQVESVDQPLQTSAVPQVVQEVEVTLPPVSGIICLRCGRGMVPIVQKTYPETRQRRVMCSLCAGRMVVSYDESNRPTYGRVVGE